MMRRLMGTTALAAALAFSTAPADAQQRFSQIVAFGDSLTDTGNLAAFGQAPGAPYVNGRFSNGPVWVEYFSQLTRTPQVSRAFGGATALGTGPTDLPAQLNAYFAANPSFRADQLVTLWIGSNDILRTAQAGGDVLGVTNRTLAANAGFVRTLAGRGARNILVFNLPDFGVIPLTAPLGAAARAQLSQVVELYRTGMFAEMDAVRNSTGANIMVVDISAAFRDIIARPAAYGLTNVTTPCFIASGSPPAIPTGACATAQGAAGTLFFDLLHPTTVGHSLTAQFTTGTMAAYLEAPQGLAAATQLGFRMFDLLNQGVAGRTAGGRSGKGSVGLGDVEGADGRFSLFAFGGWANGDRDAVTDQLAYEYDGYNVGAGIEYRVDRHLAAGVAFAYGDANADLEAGAGTIDLRSYGLIAYGTAAWGAMYADGWLAYSFDDYDTVRETRFSVSPRATGETDGDTWGAGGTFGWNLGSGGFAFGPEAGLRYMVTEIDGFDDQGAGPLALRVQDFDAESLVGSLGLQLSVLAGDAAATFVPTARIAYEREFKNDGRTVRATLPGGNAVVANAGRGERDRFVVGAGVEFSAQGGIGGSLGYECSLGGDDRTDHAVTARVRVAF